VTSSLTELLYYVERNYQPVRASIITQMVRRYDIQELAVALSQIIHTKAEGKLINYYKRLQTAVVRMHDLCTESHEF